MNDTTPNFFARNKLLLLFLFIGVWFVDWVSKQVVVVLTPSVKPSLLIKVSGTPRKGDYVYFSFQHDFIGSQTFFLTKKIACEPGDLLTVRSGVHFYCNDKYINSAKGKAIDGSVMPIFSWSDGNVPAGKFFLTGEHADSFDSRYWGLLGVKEVHRLKVIF